MKMVVGEKEGQGGTEEKLLDAEKEAQSTQSSLGSPAEGKVGAVESCTESRRGRRAALGLQKRPQES